MSPTNPSLLKCAMRGAGQTGASSNAHSLGLAVSVAQEVRGACSLGSDSTVATMKIPKDWRHDDFIDGLDGTVRRSVTFLSLCADDSAILDCEWVLK